MKDNLGIICSGLCIIHCIVTPFILALGVSDLLATILRSELIHYTLIVPMAVLILLTLPITYERYRALSLSVTGLLGMFFLIAALFLGEQKEALLTLIGGSFLIIFHLGNLRLQHKHKISGTIVERLVIRATVE